MSQNAKDEEIVKPSGDQNNRVGNLDDAEREARRAARKAERKAARKAERKAAKQNAADPSTPEDAANANSENEAVGQKPAKNNKRKRQRAVPAVVEVAPMASNARMRRRHWGIIFSFLFHVCVPLLIAGWYIWERAEDRYVSNVGFAIQQEQLNSFSSPLTDAFSSFGGSTSSSDADIVYQYLQSQSLVEAIDTQFDLRGHFSMNYDKDPIFSLAEDATLEDLVAYWPNILKISYKTGSGLIELEVLANDPQTAQGMAEAILDNSQRLINELNDQSRQDTIRYAQEDLDNAEQGLADARRNLVTFRTRTQIVDPETDLEGRLGVVNTLQQQLAEALVEADILSQSTSDTDPRVVQARNRIDVIRARLEQERTNVVTGQEAITGEDYPTLLAEYEGLVVGREIAEQSYRVALASVETARADAARQSRYIAAFVQPTLPQSTSHPDRIMMMGLVTLFALLAWTIGVLIYYSVRDSR